MEKSQEIRKYWDEEKTQPKEFYNIKNNILHGFYKSWHKNGKLAEESHWKDGKRHGSYKRWYKNGLLTKDSYYKEDKKCITKEDRNSIC